MQLNMEYFSDEGLTETKNNCLVTYHYPVWKYQYTSYNDETWQSLIIMIFAFHILLLLWKNEPTNNKETIGLLTSWPYLPWAYLINSLRPSDSYMRR